MDAQQIFDFDRARQLRDIGMVIALQHAQVGHACPTFLQPENERSWGAIYVRAQRDGIIVQDGAERSPARHGSICPRYRSLVFVGSAA